MQKVKSIASRLVLVLLLVAAFAQAGSRNLLTNPGFEILNTQGRPSNWAWSQGAPLEVVADSPKAFEGEKYIRYQDVEGTGRYVLVQNPIPGLTAAEGNPLFSLRFYTKTAGLSQPAQVRLEFFNHSSSGYRYTGPALLAETVTDTLEQWQPVELSFNIPEDTNEVWLGLLHFNLTGEICWDGGALYWINSDQAFAINCQEQITLGETLPLSIQALNYDGSVITSYSNGAKLILLDEEGHQLPEEAYSPHRVDNFQNGMAQVEVNIDSQKLVNLPQSLQAKLVDEEVSSLSATTSPITLALGTPTELKIKKEVQAVTVGTEGTFTVEILNEYAIPMPGLDVQWSLASGGGIIKPLSDQTDRYGSATAIFQAPGQVGQTRIEFSLPSAPGMSREFPVNIVSEAISFVDLPITGIVARTVTLSVAVSDYTGQPLSGRQVSVVAAPAVVTPSGGQTDAQGKVYFQLTLPEQSGPVEVIASLDNALQTTGQIVALADGPANLTLQCQKGGNPPPGGVSTQATVLVRDRYGNLVQDGTPVTFQEAYSGFQQSVTTKDGVAVANMGFLPQEQVLVKAEVAELVEQEAISLSSKAILLSTDSLPVANFPQELVWDPVGTLELLQLQFASDPLFQNILESIEVEGDRISLNSMPQGRIYWRILSGNDKCIVSSDARELLVFSSNAYLLPYVEVDQRLDLNSPTTTVSFVIKEDSYVSVHIYDMKARERACVLSKTFLQAQQAGEAQLHSYSWNGCDSQGRYLPDGLYFCLVQVASPSGEIYKTVRRIVIVR